MKRHFYSNCLGLVAIGWLLAGCSGGDGKSGKVIIIRGSNTIGEELAPRLIAEFKKDNAKVDFDTEFKGTSYGLGALMVGKCDIAAASREVTANELALSPDLKMQFKDHVIGHYSVAVVVNAANAVANLTQAQVRDIFTGTVQNWKDVGGADARIHLYIRNPVSGTYLGFQEIAMEKKAYGLEAKAFMNYAEIVREIAKDANGIGYAGIDPTPQAGTKSVGIDGVAPVAAAVKQGKYPYARVLRFYTNKTVETPETVKFAEFVESPRGQAIISGMGYVPK